MKVQSGLKVSTLKKYAKSDLLERYEGEPIYMHHGRCPSFCDYACNGNHGFKIAAEIVGMETAKGGAS